MLVNTVGVCPGDDVSRGILLFMELASVKILLSWSCHHMTLEYEFGFRDLELA